MALHVLMSPGGSPGVTTTALALTYRWGGPVLLAECDLHGGDILRGYLQGSMELGSSGLLNLAVSLSRSPDPAKLWDHVLSLDGAACSWLLLPGLADPREAPQISALWEPVVKTITAQNLDTVADLGRVSDPTAAKELIGNADSLVMLLRPNFKEVYAAKDRIDAVARHTQVSVELCLVGDGAYTRERVSDTLGRPVVAQIPYDWTAASVLSHGANARRRRVERSPLLRVASGLAEILRSRSAHRREGVGA